MLASVVMQVLVYMNIPCYSDNGFETLRQQNAGL